MKARIQQVLERAKATLPVRVLTAYGESQASSFALALAFAGFMSMFPIMLGTLSLIGFAIRDPATYAHFQNLLLQVFPPSAQRELEQALTGVKQSAGWTVTQPRPGWHQWTTPSGRTYTQAPKRYPG